MGNPVEDVARGLVSLCKAVAELMKAVREENPRRRTDHFRAAENALGQAQSKADQAARASRPTVRFGKSP